jgi:hypothetical protein
LNFLAPEGQVGLTTVFSLLREHPAAISSSNPRCSPGRLAITPSLRDPVLGAFPAIEAAGSVTPRLRLRALDFHSDIRMASDHFELR